MLGGIGPVGGAQQLQHLVRGPHPRGDGLARVIEVAQVADADAPASVLVFVGGADPPPRGSDALALLAGPVQKLVTGQRQVGAVGDVQLAVDLDAARRQCVKLGEERLRVQDDAVADDADGALEDAGRDLVQHELPGPGVHRVAGVRAPLVAHDEIGALGEHVDDLPLPLIAPLGPDDDDAVTLRSEHRPPPQQKSPRWGLLYPLGEARRKPGARQRKTVATAPATSRTPVSASRSAVSRGVCTTPVVPQFPRMTVTHSAAPLASAIPSTTTG